MPASLYLMTYCGPPPLPDDIWGRWNLDPVLLAVMAICTGLFLVNRSMTTRERASFVAGMAVLAIIFVSPLCALTVALFSARVVHHVLLVAVAAPLLAWALVRQARGKASALANGLPSLLTPLLLLHTVIFWAWHAPDAYVQALASTPVYWLMQGTLLISALSFWAAVLLASPARAITALVAITVQMGLLGALLVFSGLPLYAPHFTTTLAFGMDPLADQQLAGLIMWVPASLPYLLVAVLRLSSWLRHSEARQA
tara:strand:+ start:30722 stop:31486 length:765 start_codon:yes stop_codon:yes gene_type:complete